MHGIQLAFANGDRTPLFRGQDTGEEMTTVIVGVDATKRIAGIAMK